MRIGLLRDRIFNIFGSLSPDSPLGPVSRRYAWTIPAVAALGFLSSVLDGLGISLLIPLLGTLMASGPVNLPRPLGMLSSVAERFEPDTRVVVVGAAILGFVFLKSVVQALNAIFIAWVDGSASHDVRRALAERLLKVGYPFHLKEDQARLLNIVSTESWRASDAIRTGFGVVASTAAAVVFSVMLLMVNWRLTLAVGLGVAAIRLGQMWFVRLAHRLSEEVSTTNERLGERMLHAVQSVRVIRIFGQEARELGLFEESSRRVVRAMLRVSRLLASVSAAQETAHAALFIAVLIGANLAGVPLPSLAAFLVLLYRMQPFLRELGNARLTLAATRNSVKEVEWLLDPAGKPAEPSGEVILRELPDAIAFEKVSFRYDGADRDADVLQDVSFTLRRGRFTALLGRSGAGKSTLVNLICRLIEPTEGRIMVGEHDLARLDVAAWRGRLGFAGQDADLINGSIADNIRYGRPEADPAEVVEAARLADIDRFITGLPEGYDTLVGVGGLGLSGGQRQRVALARAFLRRPDLLILDEATNAVDGLSEAAILALLRQVPWPVTTLVISHRASTLASCDDGVVLEAGRVVEAGPLAELAAYRSMSISDEASPSESRRERLKTGGT